MSYPGGSWNEPPPSGERWTSPLPYGDHWTAPAAPGDRRPTPASAFNPSGAYPSPQQAPYPPPAPQGANHRRTRGPG